MKTVLLAGGFGTRIAEKTGDCPKPMVEVGNHPLLWHIMQHYSKYNHNDFVIALGYKGEVIKSFFLNYYAMSCNMSINLKTGSTKMYGQTIADWNVDLIDTGLQTQTGGRLARLKSAIGQETFMMTYGDGVSNIDIDALIAFHKSHGRLATLTAVRPPARFGELAFDGEAITCFTEKPQMGEGWISGGFFVLEPEVFDYIQKGDETIWEKDCLEPLAQNGQLMAYKHEGFWQPMDTLREQRYLQKLWDSGTAPWVHQENMSLTI